jgi:putative SOS response-associated peptidase YedK
MCYSALVKSSLKRVSSEFNALVNLQSFEELFRARLANPSLKIPFGLDRYFVLSQDPAEARFAGLIREFHALEREKAIAGVLACEEEMLALEGAKASAARQKKMGVLARRKEKLQKKTALDFDRLDPLDDRIFPLYFAPVIAVKNGQREIVTMRYRVQNSDGTEVPPQYNVFNARRDSLITARTWAPLFGKTHALFPFERFFEWVDRDGKKQEIYFAPDNRSSMWAASLYCEPRAPGHFASFAMVTDDPPLEVAEAGHDRCPIFLAAGQLSSWLDPQKTSCEQLLLLLQNREKTRYLHGLSA